MTQDDRFAAYSSTGAPAAPPAEGTDPGQQSRFDDGFFAGPVWSAAGTTPAPATGRLTTADGLSARWKAGIGIAVVVVLVGLGLAGRFGWQQFVADPVVPETLGGLPRLHDPSVEQGVGGALGDLRSELSDGSAVDVGFYSAQQGTGYILFAIRGGSRPGKGGSDDGSNPFAGWSRSEQDGATCWSRPAQTGAGVGVTVCMHGFWRRAVVVMGLAATPPDPVTVARATAEAWDAQ